MANTSEIELAAIEISAAMGKTLLDMQSRLMKKFQLAPNEYAVAVVRASTYLLACSARGISGAAIASDEQLAAEIGAMVERLGPVILAEIGRGV